MSDQLAIRRRRFSQWLAASSISLLANPALSGSAPKQKHIVIVGAGIVGSSIAYHLAKWGVKVTLLDRNTVASGASHGTFAWINATWAKQPEHYHAFSQAGVDAWHELQTELDLPIKWGGSLEWFSSASRQQQLATDIIEQQKWGEPAQIIDAAEALKREPLVNFTGASLVAESPRDGALDPVVISKLLVSAAETLGSKTIEACDVVNIQNTPDGQKVVQTTCGDITADRVVLATGADSSSVARLGRFELPQRSTAGVIVITDPLPPLLNGILVAPGVHIHQRIDGRLVIGEQEGAPDTEAHRARLMGRPTAFPTADISAEHARRLLTLARQYLQMPDKVVVNEVVIGWRPLPLDGLPVIGPSPEDSDTYIAVMHSGVSLAAVVGHLVARELVDGVDMAELSPYRADRVFASANRY